MRYFNLFNDRIRHTGLTILDSSLNLNFSKQGTLQRIGEFALLFIEYPDMSDPKIDWGPQPEQRQYQRQKSAS